MERSNRKQTAARRWAKAKELVEQFGTAWADAFRLASGGRVRGDDYDGYVAYQENISESPYLFGRPSAAFSD